MKTSSFSILSCALMLTASAPASAQRGDDPYDEDPYLGEERKNSTPPQERTKSSAGLSSKLKVSEGEPLSGGQVIGQVVLSSGACGVAGVLGLMGSVLVIDGVLWNSDINEYALVFGVLANSSFLCATASAATTYGMGKVYGASGRFMPTWGGALLGVAPLTFGGTGLIYLAEESSIDYEVALLGMAFTAVATPLLSAVGSAIGYSYSHNQTLIQDVSLGAAPRRNGAQLGISFTF